MSSGGAPHGVWLASAPRRSELPPAPARVQGRLRELQALCSVGGQCEVLLFVPGLLPSPRHGCVLRAAAAAPSPRLPAATVTCEAWLLAARGRCRLLASPPLPRPVPPPPPRASPCEPTGATGQAWTASTTRARARP
jgi:hypothetical protein